MSPADEHGIERVTLRQSRRRDDVVDIFVRKRRVGSLTPASLVLLGVRDGAPWTPDVQRAIERRAACEGAHRIARAALARRPMTVHEVRTRLAAKAFEHAVIEEVLAALEREGVLDDADAARRLAHHASESGAARPLVESKLTARGLDAQVVEAALRDEPGADIDDVARRKLRTLPASLDPQTRARRLFAFLARRGFGEHEAAEVVRRLLDFDGE